MRGISLRASSLVWKPKLVLILMTKFKNGGDPRSRQVPPTLAPDRCTGGPDELPDRACSGRSPRLQTPDPPTNTFPPHPAPSPTANLLDVRQQLWTGE